MSDFAIMRTPQGASRPHSIELSIKDVIEHSRRLFTTTGPPVNSKEILKLGRAPGKHFSKPSYAHSERSHHESRRSNHSIPNHCHVYALILSKAPAPWKSRSNSSALLRAISMCVMVTVLALANANAALTTFLI